MKHAASMGEREAPLHGMDDEFTADDAAQVRRLVELKHVGGNRQRGSVFGSGNGDFDVFSIGSQFVQERLYLCMYAQCLCIYCQF